MTARRSGSPTVACVVRVLLVLCLFLGAGCAVGASPEVPVGADGVADPVLVSGRQVYSSRCASCHDADGSGSRGPNITGARVTERYPNVADQIDVIVNGRGGMPSFGNSLSDDEIDAVVRYTREVL